MQLWEASCGQKWPNLDHIPNTPFVTIRTIYAGKTARQWIQQALRW